MVCQQLVIDWLIDELPSSTGNNIVLRTPMEATEDGNNAQRCDHPYLNSYKDALLYSAFCEVSAMTEYV